MEALYRKYRPSTFADLTGQEHVKTTLQNQIAAGSLAHAYLLTGPRGVGKTTVARLVARAVNCERVQSHFSGVRADGTKVPVNPEPCNECEACRDVMGGASLDVVEIDAASQTKVEETRENIIESVRFAPNRLKYKVYIIDEVHMLSTSSFNALLKTLEEPPAHALFILATTEIHKVPATIISRCQRFDFRRLPTSVMVERLKSIVKQEKVKVDDDVLEEIARHADGGLRDAESMLGQVLSLPSSPFGRLSSDSSGQAAITMEVASLVLPVTNRAMVDGFVAALAARDAKAAIRIVGDGLEQGVDLPHFTEDVIGTLRDRMLDGLGNTPQHQVAGKTPGVEPGLIESFLEARRQMKSSKIVQLPLEIAVVKACGVPNDPKESSRGLDSALAGKGSKAERIEGPKESVVNLAPLRPFEPSPLVPNIAPVATVLGDVPVLDLEDVRRRWPEVFRQIKECNATLPMVVQTGELSAVDGDSIEMSFAYSVYADAVNQDKNRRLLEGVFTSVLGRPVRVKARHVKKEVEQVVDQLIDAFGGSVV